MDSGEQSQVGQTFFTVALVAEQLGVTTRTVRRSIELGIAGPAGSRLKLGARLVATSGGQEYQIGQTALDDFLAQRAQSVQERLTDQRLPVVHAPADEECECLHQHLQRTLSTIEQQAAQIASQVQTIERLAIENGKLEAENSLLRQQPVVVQGEKPGFFSRMWRGLFGWRPALP